MGDLIHKAHLASISNDITKSMSNEELEKEYGHLRDAKPEPEEFEEVMMDENQIRSLVRRALVKVLARPGWLKGYVQHVGKEVGVDEKDKNTMGVVKDEVEQSVSEMISVFRKKYKVKA